MGNGESSPLCLKTLCCSKRFLEAGLLVVCFYSMAIFFKPGVIIEEQRQSGVAEVIVRHGLCRY